MVAIAASGRAFLGRFFCVISVHERTKNPPLSAAMDGRANSGGYKVMDAAGQSLAYVYGRETRADADTAKVLTMDEARRVASNIAKLPNYLASNPKSESE
jgi:hypothetical protein